MGGRTTKSKQHPSAPLTVGGTTALGAWFYSSWRPPDLQAHVDHLWAYSGPTASRGKRIFPNGCVELLVNVGGDPYLEVAGDARKALPTVWVSGPLVGPVVIEQPARQHCIAVRLKPLGAHALLSLPLAELSGLSVDLEDLFGAAAREVAERCAEQATHRGQLETLAEWLRARLAGAEPDRAIAWVAAQIEASSGAASIAALSDDAGLNRARLRDAFREQIGVAPKMYGRIVRFRRTLALLQSEGAPRLTEVAFAARFYDQPHMNAEFRALAGMTPSEFLRARHPVGDGSTVSERIE